MKYKEERKDSAQYQEADVSSKSIFGNHTLCAQFLRDYSGLPILANVQPEDIEDVSERYHLFQEVELQADTVKKIRLRDQAGGKQQDIYIISLIEHKSAVDYDVTMQLLKYMVCIWENYVRDLEEIRSNRHKEFLYPPIYPIVYYEGTGEWTAARSLKERILLGDLFQAYIPDFTYKLVRTREYSNEELLSKEDAISLLMLLNKMQQAQDFQEASKIPTEHLDEILQNAPVDVVDIIIATVRSLCRRLNLTAEETSDFIEKIRGGNMGYLFENMEKMDIQLERRNTAEQRKRAEDAEQEAASQRQRAEKAEREKLNLYGILLSTYKKQEMKKGEAKNQLKADTGLNESVVDELLEKFWENG